jgi:hypothetical protein
MEIKIMFRYSPFTVTTSIFALVLSSTSAFSSPYDREVTAEDLEQERVYSPFVGRNYPDQVLFGDTHFHTNQSFDAGMVGTKLGIDEGFRFAREKKSSPTAVNRCNLFDPSIFWSSPTMLNLSAWRR